MAAAIPEGRTARPVGKRNRRQAPVNSFGFHIKNCAVQESVDINHLDQEKIHG